MFQRVSTGSRFEVIAAAWGALPAAIALMALNPLPDTAIFSGVLLAFMVGGFLSGVRATRRRVLHGVAAALIGVGVYMAFVALTQVLSLASGTPDGLTLQPSDPARFGLLIAAGVLLSAAGAFAAGSLLSSPGATRLGG